MSNIERCVHEIDHWMLVNRLTLSKGKTELLKYSPLNIYLAQSFKKSVVNESICSSQKARNIGIIFDNHFLVNEHIASICKSCFYHLRNISHLRKYLSSTATELLVHASVSSKLDHCTEFFSLWLTELPNKTVTAHPECRCSFYHSFKKTWRPGLQVLNLFLLKGQMSY